VCLPSSSHWHSLRQKCHRELRKEREKVEGGGGAGGGGATVSPTDYEIEEVGMAAGGASPRSRMVGGRGWRAVGPRDEDARERQS
jgi:hypothetical protein